MQLIKRLIVLAACCYLVTACKKNADNPTNSAVADTDQPKSMLVYYEKTTQGVGCFRKYLPDDSSKLIANFPSEPLDAIWDKAQQSSYFITREGIFKKSFHDSGDLTQKVSDPLPPHSSDMFGQAWIDRVTGHFRISYCVASDVDAEYAKKFKALAMDTTNKLPEWGAELIEFVAEADELGKWNPVVEKASKGQAGQTPGFDVVIKYIDKKENIIATSELLTTSTCLDWKTNRKKEISGGLPDYEVSYVNGKMPETPDMTDQALIKINSRFEILALVTYGDTPHFSKPLYLLDVEQRLLKDLTSTNLESHSQLGILKTCNFVLLAGEYRHERPSIYEADGFKLIAELPNATHAIILEPNCDK